MQVAMMMHGRIEARPDRTPPKLEFACGPVDIAVSRDNWSANRSPKIQILAHDHAASSTDGWANPEPANMHVPICQHLTLISTAVDIDRARELTVS